MQTKTIRFEKGDIVPFWKIEAIAHTFFIGMTPFFSERKDKNIHNSKYYECLNSFTVQINIIEDEEPINLFPTTEVLRDGGTRVYLDKTGKKYFKAGPLYGDKAGKMFDRFPGEEGAKIIDILYKLIEYENI